MRRIGLSLVIALAGLAVPFLAAPGEAQSTWVSGAGNDNNSCLTVASPCRQIGGASGAIAKAGAAGAVVHVLPGGYNPTSIGKSVQIIATPGQASINSFVYLDIAPFFPGLYVSAAPTGAVAIRGLTVDRGYYPTSSGIVLVSAASLHLEDCTIVNNSSGFAIVFRPSGDSELMVSNCTIANFGGGGIEVRPAAGTSAKVTLNNVRILNNKLGISVFSRSTVTVRGSTVTGNATGVRANGSTAIVRMADSTVSRNNKAFVATNGGQIVSHRGNVVADNQTNGAFTSTVNQQ